MEQLFLVPACSPDSLKNVNITLNNKINLEQECLDCGLTLSDIVKKGEANGLTSVNMWGTDSNKKDIWEKVEISDSMLYYSKDDLGESRFTHFGVVIATIHSKILAKQIWDNEAFEFIHICDNTEKVDLDKNIVFDYLGYKMLKVQGFMRVLEFRLEKTEPHFDNIKSIIEYIQLDDTYSTSNNLGTSSNKINTPVKKESFEERKNKFDDLIEAIKNGTLIIPDRKAEKAPQNCPQDRKGRSETTYGNTKFSQLNGMKESLGSLGEEIIVIMERNRLEKVGRKDLAAKVDRVSKKSNKYGYDILSFENNGNEKYIEVKTTTRGKNVPFDLTWREKETSDKNYINSKYYLYRIYNLDSKNFEFEYYIIEGSLTYALQLDAMVYRAYVK